MKRALSTLFVPLLISATLFASRVAPASEPPAVEALSAAELRARLDSDTESFGIYRKGLADVASYIEKTSALFPFTKSPGAQLLTESVTLACLGGVAGLLVALAGMQVFEMLKPPVPVSVVLDLNLAPSVLVFTIVLSVAAGLLFGLAPARAIGATTARTASAQA